jgi:monoamine oxidase
LMTTGVVSSAAWPNWNPGAPAGGEPVIDTPGFRLLNQPHGRVHFSGAHLSQIPGWQEGAVLSAHRTIAALAAQVTATTTLGAPAH